MSAKLPVRQAFPVVGIGASAGGLEALSRFLAVMPAASGMAFVVVQHLDPTKQSLMADLLARHTAMPVLEARDRMRVQADHVYVIPPNRYLAVRGGILRLSAPRDPRGLRTPINHFFRSLALDQGDDAVGIVLTGTGSEGALGVRAIKAAGGTALAQDPETAQHPGMPASAIATGLVDAVLPIEAMPEALLAYARHPWLRPRDRQAPVPEEAATLLDEVLGRLRSARGGRDFRGYKRGTLLRRIARRMGMHGIERPEAYLELLRKDGKEVEHLGKDLLIGVTSFFREPQAFEELRVRAIRKLVRRTAPGAALRVWVPGCATGEEAYTIAMLFTEEIAAAASACRLQVFGTDVDDTALAIGRAGVYGNSIALDVRPRRLRQFFTRHEHGWRISKQIRELVVFAHQDLLGDPSFSKLDLVSCRNLLIYLEPEFQRRLVRLFHFALNANGWLILGSAEGIGQDQDLFVNMSKKWRIFRRVAGPRRFAAVPAGLPAAAAGATRHAPTPAGPEPATLARPAAIVQQQLLEHQHLAGVLVDRKGDILHFHGHVGSFLDLPAGEPSLRLLDLARDDLRAKLQAGLVEAARRQRPVALATVRVAPDGSRRAVGVTVRPVTGPGSGDGLLMVVFEESPQRIRPVKTGAGQQVAIRQLEDELKVSRDDLRHNVERMATNTEELKASHEEVTSMNEELQSTNEELETSKEELQSMNEELGTVNTELQEKVRELTAANNDLGNLLASTEIATVFLDPELRVKRFTPPATRLLNLIPADLGRPLRHIALGLEGIDVLQDATAVLQTRTAVARQARSRNGETFVVRILPYRTAEGSVAGVVLTFADVSALKDSERALEIRKRQQEAIAELGQQALSGVSPRELMELTVKAAARVLGAESCGLFELSSGTRRLTLRTGTGLAATVAKAPATWRLAPRQASVLLAGDILHFPRSSRRRTAARGRFGHGMRDGITAMVRCDGQAWGALGAYTALKRAFAPDEVAFLRAAADILSGSLTRARHEERLEERTERLTLLHDVTRAVNDARSVEEAVRRVHDRICAQEPWSFGNVFFPRPEDPDELDLAHCLLSRHRRTLRRFAASQRNRRFRRGTSLANRVLATGKAEWAAAMTRATLPGIWALAQRSGVRTVVAFPVLVGREVVAVIEFFSDQVLRRSEALVALMGDIGTQLGRIIERQRLQRGFAEAVWQEQQRVVQELHDSLGQELTGLGFSATTLAAKLRRQGLPEARSAKRVKDGIQRFLAQIRALSQGLFPVGVDRAGLMHALRQLAATTQAMSGIRCRFDCLRTVHVDDNKVATHVYRIAQEAVTNAVRHARPRHITVTLRVPAGRVTLAIRDDGTGWRDQYLKTRGTGLRIMRSRADVIGATLKVEPASRRGTVVTCTLPEAARAVGAEVERTP